jgi:hypothetical protein
MSQLRYNSPDAAGAEGGENLVRAEADAGGERHQCFVGTRRFNSSNQFTSCYFFNAVAQLSTTAIGAAVASLPLGGRGIRKR